TAQTQSICASFVQSFKTLSQVLNIFGEAPKEFLNTLRMSVLSEKGILEKDIQEKISQRSEARAKKDFATSDKIRNDLLLQGIELRDLPHGTEWDILFKS
ncbi:MAG: hypothetical protein ACKOA8_06025, partial [Deltaproteobacteria bacterium]